MGRLILGVVVAAIVLYLFGFLYWGLGTYYQTMVWKQATDEAAAASALETHFPENGTYYLPGFGHDEETLEQRFDDGPVAFVHMLAVDGRPMMDPSIMIGGFALNVLAIIMIAGLLKVASPALPTYAARVGFVALAGAAATIFIEGNAVVWWQITWQWKLYQAVYDVGFWILTGVVLAAFIGPEPQADAPAETAAA